MSFLDVKGIVKSFGKTEVLKGIDFSMDKGEVLAIIGSSGSGKTTLLRCLNFLETPDAGKITVDGNVLFDSDEPPYSDAMKREKRLHFGLVFQSFNLFPQYNVLKNVSLAQELRRIKGKKLSKDEKKAVLKEIDERSRNLIDTVGLSAKLENYPCELSGGQQQRVAIARALASKPSIILADEPTGNLDSKTSDDVIGLLKMTSREFHQTIVMITHNPAIAQMADRIVRIEDGRIVAQA